MKIQPRHATYVALAVAVLLLIAGAVMLGIGASKLSKANNKKCESPAPASELYVQALVTNVSPGDLSSNKYQNVSERIRTSFSAALASSNQQPEVTILLLEPSVYSNRTAVCFASLLYSRGKAPTTDTIHSAKLLHWTYNWNDCHWNYTYWAYCNWAYCHWTYTDWFHRYWAYCNWAYCHWTYTNWSYRYWAYCNWVYCHWAYTDWSHRYWAYCHWNYTYWAYCNWAYCNWAYTDWSHRYWAYRH
ncbi:hypothetical protein QR680_018213 [Steinernema hermaphroditum]|uniref:SEA domain-containing protein n=1 Tax=Steinernema hermaphroditum TaxID=289476 RepID=A0AA39LQR0_9BILA|nr:hypothetical protein QR680_018213 [Steinernema hermaphroditum]